MNVIHEEAAAWNIQDCSDAGKAIKIQVGNGLSEKPHAA